MASKRAVTAPAFTLFGGVQVAKMKPRHTASKTLVSQAATLPAEPRVLLEDSDVMMVRQLSSTPPPPSSLPIDSATAIQAPRSNTPPPPSQPPSGLGLFNCVVRVDKRSLPKSQRRAVATPPAPSPAYTADQVESAKQLLSAIGAPLPSHASKRELIAVADAYRERHEALVQELIGLHTRGLIQSDLSAHAMTQRTVIVDTACFEAQIDWHAYPSQRSVSVTNRHGAIFTALDQALHATAYASQPMLLTRLVRFAVVLMGSNSGPHEVWADLNDGEELRCLVPQKKDPRQYSNMRFIVDEEELRRRLMTECTAEFETLMMQHCREFNRLWQIYTEERRAQMCGDTKRQRRAQRYHGSTAVSARAVEVVDEPMPYHQLIATFSNCLAIHRDSPGNAPTTVQFANMPHLLHVPPQIAQLEWLEQLDLSNCGLADLPSLGTMRLRKLFLQKNRFRTIPACVLTVHMQELRVLDMSHNALEVIPAELGQLRSLEVLQLDYNMIRRMECDFSGMPRLEAIDLVDNALRSLPASIGSLERLWRLKVSANPLTQIPPEVYHRGVDAIKRFFSEMSPQNLAVPASRLVEELLAAVRREASCDAVLVGRDGSRVRTLAALVQARLPGLFTREDERHRTTCTGDGSDASAEWTIDVGDVLGARGLQSLHEVILGGALEAVAADDVETLVEVGAAVQRWGSDTLRQQLQRAERSQTYDGNALIASDLEQLWQSCAAPVGRVARFVVGAAPGVEFAVHRELLCARSEYFARMLRGGLAESGMAVVPLEGVEAEVFRAFVAYVYGDNTSKMTPENVVSLLFLAVEYDCARLKAMAECVVGLNVEVDNVAQVLQVAHYLGAERLRKTCCFFAATHLSAVKRTSGWAELTEELKARIKGARA